MERFLPRHVSGLYLAESRRILDETMRLLRSVAVGMVLALSGVCWYARSGKGGLVLDITCIRERLAEGRWRLSYHALQRCDERDLDVADLISSLADGEVLEEYPDDPRGPSCLVLCKLPDGSFLHAVCGMDGSGWLVVITVYRPEKPKWIDERTRGKV